MKKIRFTVEGPIGKYDTVVALLEKEGCKTFGEELVGTGIRTKHKHYKKPAIELVFDALKENKGMAMRVDTLHKAMDMPKGTISSSLDKLKKTGRVKNDGNGRWAVK
jgi:hypothetical protein